MIGNIVVNAILAGILYALYLWTPWASLVLASLSSFAFTYIFLFDKKYVEEITPTESDKTSIILGASVSYIGVIISVVSLVK